MILFPALPEDIRREMFMNSIQLWDGPHILAADGSSLLSSPKRRDIAARAIEWCHNNCGAYWTYDLSNDIFMFELEEDATLFVTVSVQ